MIFIFQIDFLISANQEMFTMIYKSFVKHKSLFILGAPFLCTLVMSLR